ncbi:hypothetical protein ACN2C6_03170 [Caulobacter sp. ErkDOM-YI]|uniref:hypothetical protein n=1 Tax=unclassified Caulobacter TaxID=2648921 RepID=UPI003AF59BDE
MFSDHAVQQRSQPIRVWGVAQPGAGVEIDLSGATTLATADVRILVERLLLAEPCGPGPKPPRS